MRNSIECILYTNPLAVRHLDALGVVDDGSSLVIELSASSVLAPVFDQQGIARFGVAGLLGRAQRIHRLGEVFDGMRNPVVLGSRPAVPPESSAGALSLLRSIDVPYQRIVVLLHLAEISRFAYALQMVDRFSILLADSDPVPFALPSKAQLLAQMQMLDATSWAGLFFFDPSGADHGGRLDADCLDVLDEFEGYVRSPRSHAA
ncbi:hypothetical protein HFP89_14350 [Wenzhouxiangella sp. XN79A]|uniref:hypothetical protein n=1 Tax=Wenzhouxiangella sp. XN79A TaxID=2724193 RepID=UPI00144AD3E1|nr:hypothetical protein [Wenzhouxiangella sp. XN79A]NKI36348.1 hypothetical protein [Wenzhouxiangella sp. XN79A]